MESSATLTSGEVSQVQPAPGGIACNVADSESRFSVSRYESGRTMTIVFNTEQEGGFDASDFTGLTKLLKGWARESDHRFNLTKAGYTPGLTLLLT